MYRVLIVDDEEPVLDSYEFMLKSVPAFALAAKARSGFEALKAIHETEPDLVFMDINIPGLDGLEVISDVHKKFPAMIFVLSTAYERFDLARRAIPLGVFAYLVKPVSKKTFLETLETVREHLRRREDRPDPENPAGAEESPGARFFRRTIWRALGEAEWEACRQELSLPSDRGIPFILEMGDQEAFQRGAASPLESYCALLAERLSYKYHCRYDVMLNRGIFLVSGDAGRAVLKDQLERIFREAPPPGEAFFWGLGETRRGPDLYLSCGAALRELEDRRLREGTDPLNRERRQIIRLRGKIGITGAEEARKLFGLLARDIFAAGDFNLGKAKMVSLFRFLMDDLGGTYHRQDGEAPLFDAAAEIMALENPAAWETWAAAAFEKILHLAELRRSGRFPLPLVRAVEFIREHYTEGIQLRGAAEAARVSEAYLSRLFAEHLKTNFVDYVTELRIEKAETLIREGRLNMKEIAYAVGLESGYFSKLFRKVTGLSPTRYSEQPAPNREPPSTD